MDKKKKQQENESPSQQLYSHLFEACNIMRGPINQVEYKSYITPLLFFKRISDSFDEETEIALKESDGDKEYAAFPENHIFQIPEGCHWIDVRNKSENIGKAIVNAMNGIERANQDKIAGLFSSFDDANWTDKNKLSDERLKNLIEHMSQVRLRNSDYPSDVMGDAYEYLIKKFADLSKKNAGEFYTPRTIVKLMIWLLDPQPGDSVYDKTTPILIQFHTLKNAANPPFLGGFSIFGTVAAGAEQRSCQGDSLFSMILCNDRKAIVTE